MKQVSMLPLMLRRWDSVGRKLALKAETPGEFEAWKKAAIAKLKELIGYDTMLKAPLEPRVLDSEDKGGYIQEHILIQTQPDVFVPMYVLKPKKSTDRLQPVIAVNGHDGGGKVAVAGIPTCPEVAAKIKEYNYDYGKQLAQQGFLVFCPDSRGFGETKEPLSDPSIFLSSCLQLNQMAIPLGQTVMGMWTWDLHRLIDYIETRNDCQMSKLCCVGLSGGGWQTMWASALDERIRCAVISGFLYGFKQSLLEMHTNCSCNYIPHLWEYVDAGDIAALIAPRKLFIETGGQDELNGRDGLENVKSQVRILEKAYAVHKKQDNLKHSICSGGHQWYGTGVVDWLLNCDD